MNNGKALTIEGIDPRTLPNKEPVSFRIRVRSVKEHRRCCAIDKKCVVDTNRNIKGVEEVLAVNIRESTSWPSRAFKQ